PKFTGVPQGPFVVARWETQMSKPPWEPGRSVRSLVMYRLSPFGLIAGCWSLNAELTAEPRLTGVSHGPNELSSTQRSSSGSTVGLAAWQRLLREVIKTMTELSFPKRSAVRMPTLQARRPNAGARLGG